MTYLYALIELTRFTPVDFVDIERREFEHEGWSILTLN